MSQIFRGERAGEVLFELEGCGGHPSPFGAARQDLASTLAAGAYRSGRPGGSHDTELVLSPTLRSGPPSGGPAHGKINGSDRGAFDNESTPLEPTLASPILAREGKGPDSNLTSGNLVIGPRAASGLDVSGTLQANSHPGGVTGQDGQTGRNLVITPAIVMHPDAVHRDGIAQTDSLDAEGRARKRNAGSGIREDGQSFTLNAGEPPTVSYVLQDAREGVSTKNQNGAGVRDAGEGAYTLDTLGAQAVAFTPSHYSRGKSGAPSETAPAQYVVFQQSSQTGRGTIGARSDGTAKPVTTKSDAQMLQSGSMIRRLTPLECERLQGFPDGWTCLCMPLEAWAEAPAWAMERCKCPDGPRYRGIGNAVTTTVPRWLGARIAAVLRGESL